MGMKYMRKLDSRPRFAGTWPADEDGWTMLDCWRNGLYYAAEYHNVDTGREILCIAKIDQYSDDDSGFTIALQDSYEIPFAALCAVAHDCMGFGVDLSEEIPRCMDRPYRLMTVEHLSDAA